MGHPPSVGIVRTAAAAAALATLVTGCAGIAQAPSAPSARAAGTDAAGTPPPAAPTRVATVVDSTAALERGRAFARDPRAVADRLPEPWPIVRGVYSTMWSFWGQRWEHMLGLVRDTEINAIVIDVKDDKGQLAWQMDHPLAEAGGGGEGVPDADPSERLQQLIDAGGYPIARVVCFKDSKVALARPDLAVVDTRTGQPWEGRDGQHWLNPYADEAWQWCIDVGLEAARVGFKEIQFDYVRFPNGGDGPSAYFEFPGRPADRPRERWRHPDEITDFLRAASEQLHAAGVFVSADIFGLTTYNWSWDGDGTGQVFERLAEHLDYLSPMVYPSHYGPDNYGLSPHPVDHPYELIWHSMLEARLRSQGLKATIRPWLEDFAPTWMGRGHSPARVVAQKRGVYENGIEGWLLWNASNRFSMEALEPGPAEPRATADVCPAPRTKDPQAPDGAERRRWPGRPAGLRGDVSLPIGEGSAIGLSPGDDLGCAAMASLAERLVAEQAAADPSEPATTDTEDTDA